jgi:hypothetical protein
MASRGNYVDGPTGGQGAVAFDAVPLARGWADAERNRERRARIVCAGAQTAEAVWAMILRVAVFGFVASSVSLPFLPEVNIRYIRSIQISR